MAAADPIWKKKLMESLGFTPRYDIDITHQYGKPHRGELAQWNDTMDEAFRFGESGAHPGIESGYMGGLSGSEKGWKSPADTITLTDPRRWGDNPGLSFNKAPTQVGWNKPSIKGGAGGGFKRVLKHLGAMESPGPDWSLQAQNVGVRSPWSPTNVAWSPVGGTMLDWKKKRTA